jgi:hypothetical protein
MRGEWLAKLMNATRDCLMRRLSIALAAACAASLFAGRLHAQITETPVAFDSAQRVMAITPSLVERLHLAAPQWPVSGDFRDARLYAVQPNGGYVIVVQRPAGAVERYPLTESQRASLRSTVDAGMATSGRPTAEVGSDVISEPAGNAFVRNQTILSAIAYGPLAASLVDDGAGAGALYLLTTGGTFFVTYGIAQSTTVTRAQNHLAGTLGLAGGAAGWLTGFALADNSDKGVRTLALGSAIAGSVAGYNLGRHLSDAEAHAAGFGVHSTALTALGIATALNASDRGIAATVAAAEIIGYPLGLAYPRSTSYTVTAGDVDAVGTVGVIGAMYGGAILGDAPRSQALGAVLTGTYLGGLLLGDAWIARTYDFTESQANLAQFGAVAGGLVGLTLPVLAGSDNNSFIWGAAAVGATFGMAAVVSSGSIRRAGASPSSRQSRADSPSRRTPQVTFTPTSLLGVLHGTPGRYSLVNIRF